MNKEIKELYKTARNQEQKYFDALLEIASITKDEKIKEIIIKTIG